MFNTIDLLKMLVKFNTESKHTNLPLIYFLKNILEKNEFQVQVFKYGTKANLVAKLGEGGGGLIFSGHTDTVPAGNSWKTNPFQLIKKQNRFYGLGTVDMKGAIAAMITAVFALKKEKTKMKKPLYLVFTFDEEKDFNGIKKILNTEIIKMSNLAIIGEPTGMQPVIAHKGVVALDVGIFGKEAHSSNPEQGINAVEVTGDLIQKLKQLSLEIQWNKDFRFKPAYSTLNIGKIKGGSAINKVPDFCLLSLEYRAISLDDDKYLFQQIQRLSKGVVKKYLTVPPFESSIDKNSLSVIEAVTERKSKAVSYATEAIFYEKHGIPAIILGPGDIKRAHQPDEFITKNELIKAITCFRSIIKRFCF